MSIISCYIRITKGQEPYKDCSLPTTNGVRSSVGKFVFNYEFTRIYYEYKFITAFFYIFMIQTTCALFDDDDLLLFRVGR